MLNTGSASLPKKKERHRWLDGLPVPPRLPAGAFLKIQADFSRRPEWSYYCKFGPTAGLRLTSIFRPTYAFAATPAPTSLCCQTSQQLENQDGRPPSPFASVKFDKFVSIRDEEICQRCCERRYGRFQVSGGVFGVSVSMRLVRAIA